MEQVQTEFLIPDSQAATASEAEARLQAENAIRESGLYPEKNNVRAEFLYNQRMEGIGRLTGGIAHDFNNMLTIMTGYTEMVRQLTLRNPDIQGKLGQVLEAGTRAAELAQRLMDYSRKMPPRLQALDLKWLVDGIVRLCGNILGKTITIKTELEENLPNVMGDKAALEQVLMNLLINARDAMPYGGDIIITTKNLENEKWVCLSVSDTGGGMDEETIKHIFEPFYTTKEEGKGTGLGLSVVDGIVRQHGGRVEVKSHPGEGTEFYIFLPGKHNEEKNEEKGFK